MVYLVLDNSGSIPLHTLFHLFPFDIHPFYVDRSTSFYCAEKTRKAQTSLLITDYFSSFFCDYRVYHEDNRVLLIIFFLGKSHYDYSLIDTYLWCSQADSSMFWVFDIGEHRFTEHSVFMELLGLYWCRNRAKNGVVFSCLNSEFHMC